MANITVRSVASTLAAFLAAILFISLFDYAFKPRASQSRGGQACLFDEKADALAPFWSVPDSHTAAMNYIVNRRATVNSLTWGTLQRRIELDYPLLFKRKQIESVFCQSATVAIKDPRGGAATEMSVLNYIDSIRPDFNSDEESALFGICAALDGRPVANPPAENESVALKCRKSLADLARRNRR